MARDYELGAAAIGKDSKGWISIAIYITGICVSLLQPWLGFALYIVVAIIWLIPDRRIEDRVREWQVFGRGSYQRHRNRRLRAPLAGEAQQFGRGIDRADAVGGWSVKREVRARTDSDLEHEAARERNRLPAMPIEHPAWRNWIRVLSGPVAVYCWGRGREPAQLAAVGLAPPALQPVIPMVAIRIATAGNPLAPPLPRPARAGTRDGHRGKATEL